MYPNEGNDLGLDLRWTPGPYGAPRQDGLDPRWGDDFLYLANILSEEDFDYFWGALAAAWDQGSREHPNGMPNPYWQDWRPLK